MKPFALLAVLVLAMASLFAGCRTPPPAGPPALRVGVCPQYPPLVYRQADQLKGIEPELARRLGTALERPVQFVELAWEDLIPALLDKRIDLIMSGMTITKERGVRIRFSDPYLKNYLVAVTRRADQAYYPSAESVLQCEKNIGVMKGSTAESFVQSRMPRANAVPFAKNSEIASYFTFNRITLYIGDVYACAWLVSENETALAGIWFPLQEEWLGWGLRPQDTDLRASVNRILAGWKKDGTLKTVLDSRVPYLDRIDWKSAEAAPFE